MVGPATYLVTPPRRLASQALAPLRFADSSSLVTPLVTPPVVSADPARSPDGPPATSARARRFPTRESSRDFPADRATAPGSPPCSRGDIPRLRSNAGVRDGANRAQITGCNGRICADRRGTCRAPSRSARHATTLSPVTLQSGSRGKKIHPTKKNFFWMKFRKNTLKPRRHFQTAGRKPVSSRRCQTKVEHAVCRGYTVILAAAPLLRFATKKLGLQILNPQLQRRLRLHLTIQNSNRLLSMQSADCRKSREYPDLFL